MKDNNQKINCDVTSCKYNDSDEELCTLDEIKVSNEDETSEEKEDTICASYELDEDEREE